MKPLTIAATCLALAVPAAASDTESWMREGKTLRTGTLEGMSIAPEGTLVPGAARTELGKPGAPLLWTLAAGGDEVLAGSGESGGLWRLASGKEPQRLARLEKDPDVFAIVIAGKTAFAATGPRGAVYRVDIADGKAEELFRPEAAYIWSLALLQDGDLAVATGAPGKVWRVATHGKATPKLLWEARDTHVRRLALGANGTLYAGTAPSGLLVELDGKGGAFVLYDSGRPETVALASDAAGTLWAAFSGNAGKGEGGGTGERKSGAPVAGGSMSITVRPRAEGDDEAAKAKGEDKADARPPELPGGGGELVRLAPGREPEVIWSDGRETPLALAARPGGGVLLGTAGPARIYWFDGAGSDGWWDEVPSSAAVSALAVAGERVLAAASNPAQVLAYGPARATGAAWTSDVFDAKRRARIGRVHAVTTAAGAAQVTVKARVGNTAEPGPGWTDWTVLPGAAAPPAGDGGGAAFPLARYVQVRVESGATAAAVSRVVVRYHPLNRAPRIEQFDAQPQGVAYRAMPPSQVSSGEIPVVDVARGPDAERAVGDSVGAWRSKKAYEQDALTLTWQGKDPDDDGMLASIDVCRDDGAPCTAWTNLAKDLAQAFYSFDSRELPDGVYRFRLTLDDAPSNPLGDGLSAVRVSDPVVIDHAAPVIDRLELAWRDGKLALTLAVHDTGGRIGAAYAAREPGDFCQLAPADGVEDAAQETFGALLEPPPAGQPVTVQVVDAAGNVTTSRAEVPAKR